MKRRFILFDGRAADGDTEGAMCFGFEDTMKAAIKSARDHGEAAIFSFVEVPGEPGKTDYTIEGLRLEKVVRS